MTMGTSVRTVRQGRPDGPAPFGCSPVITVAHEASGANTGAATPGWPSEGGPRRWWKTHGPWKPKYPSLQLKLSPNSQGLPNYSQVPLSPLLEAASAVACENREISA